jgi:hypothetical protein
VFLERRLNKLPAKAKIPFVGSSNKRMANKKGKMKMKVINTNTNE